MGEAVDLVDEKGCRVRGDWSGSPPGRRTFDDGPDVTLTSTPIHGDDIGQGCLPQAGRAVQKDMIKGSCLALAASIKMERLI